MVTGEVSGIWLQRFLIIALFIYLLYLHNFSFLWFIRTRWIILIVKRYWCLPWIHHRIRFWFWLGLSVRSLIGICQLVSCVSQYLYQSVNYIRVSCMINDCVLILCNFILICWIKSYFLTCWYSSFVPIITAVCSVPPSWRLKVWRVLAGLCITHTFSARIALGHWAVPFLCIDL